jgi:haloalkane dehalogenase
MIKNFPFPSRFIEINGSQMHYINDGKGKNLLLLHGNPASIYIWRNIIPRLSKNYRVIAVDLIGFGKSEKPDIEYSFEDHYSCIRDFIMKMKLDEVVLVMHDWGSAIGFHFAKENPELIKGLAFFESLITPLPGLDKWPEQSREAFKIYRSERGWDSIVNDNDLIENRLQEGIIRKLDPIELNSYREPFENPSSRKPLWKWPNELPINGKPAHVARIQSEYLHFLVESDLPKLLLFANPGVLTPESVVSWCQANMKHLETIYLGEGLHNLQEDLPFQISEALLPWLSKIQIKMAQM